MVQKIQLRKELGLCPNEGPFSLIGLLELKYPIVTVTATEDFVGDFGGNKDEPTLEPGEWHCGFCERIISELLNFCPNCDLISGEVGWEKFFKGEFRYAAFSTNRSSVFWRERGYTPGGSSWEESFVDPAWILERLRRGVNVLVFKLLEDEAGPAWIKSDVELEERMWCFLRPKDEVEFREQVIREIEF